MAGLPHRDSDRLTSGLALAGATHRSPTSLLSLCRRGWRRWGDMTECRGADAAMAFRDDCIADELQPHEALRVEEPQQ